MEVPGAKTTGKGEILTSLMKVNPVIGAHIWIQRLWWKVDLVERRRTSMPGRRLLQSTIPLYPLLQSRGGGKVELTAKVTVLSSVPLTACEFLMLELKWNKQSGSFAATTPWCVMMVLETCQISAKG